MRQELQQVLAWLPHHTPTEKERAQDTWVHGSCSSISTECLNTPKGLCPLLLLFSIFKWLLLLCDTEMYITPIKVFII